MDSLRCVCASLCAFYLLISALGTHLFHAGCPFTPLQVLRTICVCVIVSECVCQRECVSTGVRVSICHPQLRHWSKVGQLDQSHFWKRGMLF